MRENDAYLDSLRIARESRAVLKTELATFLSGCDESAKVFAFEGTNDRKVYYHWIKAAGTNITYEPFICKTKPRALKLLDTLVHDATNLGERVYFFLDRDFDELQGREVSEKTYLTDRYSIENHLVCTTALNDILMVDFQCGGDKETRETVLHLFNSDYKKFLECTKDLNWRIFLARRLQINQLGELPQRVDAVASINLGAVEPANAQATDLVQLEREPTEEEALTLAAEFDQLAPHERYRGKFAWLFFQKWLSLLATDRQAEQPTHFCRARAPEGGVPRGFSMDAIAAKSKPPESLRLFLAAIAGAQAQ